MRSSRRAALSGNTSTYLRQHTSAYVSIRQHDGSIRQHTRRAQWEHLHIPASAYVSIRQYTSAYASMMSAYVSIRRAPPHTHHAYALQQARSRASRKASSKASSKQALLLALRASRKASSKASIKASGKASRKV